MIRRFLLFSGCLSLLTGAALGQDAGRDPALPEIAPSEVEIRGELDPSLPSLQRQPLTGFGHLNRVANLPPDRRPYAENYQQADLPQSPLRRPLPPEISSLAGRPPIRGEFEASTGRYFSRIVQGHTALPVSSKTSFYGTVDYEGSDGFAPADALSEATSQYDDFDVQLGVQTIFSKLIGGLEFDGLYENYALYGIPDVDAGQDRTGNKAAGAVWLRTHGDTKTDFQTRLDFGSTKYETPAGFGSSFDAARTEQQFNLSSQLEAPIPTGTIFARAKVGTGALSGGDANTAVTSYDAGGGFRFFYRRNLALTLGGALMGYTVEPGGAAVGERESHFFISPAVRAELYPAQGVRLYVRNEPGVEHHSLAALYAMNPFLVESPEVQPTVRTIDAEAGASLMFGAVRLLGRTGFQRMPNFLFFEHENTGLMAAHYGDATVAYVGGDFSIVLPGGFQATIGGTIRDGSLENPDGDDFDIPYYGPISGHAMLSLSFADSRGLLQAIASYESSRYVDRARTRQVGDFLDLDTALFYNITPSLGLVARVDNISAGQQHLERWDRYAQPPVTVMGGVQVKW